MTVCVRTCHTAKIIGKCTHLDMYLTEDQKLL